VSLDALQIAGRVGASVGLGALVGVERELRDKAAGVMTHALLSLGACTFALISVDAFASGSDPARVAAQIVTGVGFLGAGTIIRSGGSVRGLTTAASLWVVAAVGTACGVGYLGPAAGVAATAIASLLVLRQVKTQLRRHIGEHAQITLSTTGLGDDISAVLATLGESTAKVAHLDIAQDEDGEGRLFTITVDSSEREPVETLMQALGRIPNVGRVEFSEL
jgi:putative Mg2+ transporter-C (MgtC) family protein